MVRTILGLMLLAGAASAAEPPETWRFDLGLTLSRFEQQVKAEIGGARGERLVEESMVGLMALATWRAWGPLSVGWYGQIDAGGRRAGRFVGLDADQKTIVEGEVGGDFTEIWTGPLVRAAWRGLFLELGYGLVGWRDDDARGDLRDADGGADAALRTSPTVAWAVGLGAALPVWESLDVVLRLQYRVRYYDRRGDADLADSLVHGTQNFTPFFGAAWRLP
ncbi:MAG: hypothetical protein H6706_17420 [Myxococcales bacterium]|nr:hypothetical protein [Myxococcales bacterium]